jgi:hypothetical protein
MEVPLHADPTRECAQCGEPFKPERSIARYCSTRCAGLSRRTLPEPDPRPCERCGSTFTPPRKYPKQRYCSGYCQRCAGLGTDDSARQAARSGPRPESRGVKPGGYPKRGQRHEHRIVAEQRIGRQLKPGEIVHHIDGNSSNNDPANLQVLASQSEHARLHAAQRKGVTP